MITLFSTPKNFTGIFSHIQLNALRSWRSISPDIQIIIFGDSKGSQEAALKIKADYIPKVRCSQKGTPYASDLFKQAKELAKFPILTFINADIILPNNFLNSVSLVSNSFSNYLMIGHRWDREVDECIDFENSEKNELFWNKFKNEGEMHAPSGIDYFVFNKDLWKSIPDFIIGRPGFDNWLIWKARRKLIPVVDASEEMIVVHQNHHFNFHNLKVDPKINPEEEGESNKKIHGGKTLNILDSTYKLEGNSVKKKNNKEFKVRNLHRLPSIFPEFSILIKLYRRLYKLFLPK